MTSTSYSFDIRGTNAAILDSKVARSIILIYHSLLDTKPSPSTIKK